MEVDKRRSDVSKYYGETLKTSADLRTSACCPSDSVPSDHAAVLKKLHPEVVSRFYGCGSTIPDIIRGATILDLGCGTGRDAYLASGLVGAEGHVIGIDMTDAQLEIAEMYKEYHATNLLGEGVPSNVEFRKGIIEDLAAAADVQDNSIDVVISNCVCNLSADKTQVFRQVFRVLKEGGEFHFSDIYSDRRLTPEALSNEVLIGECLGGLYIEDFRRIMAEIGFSDIRVVSCAPVVVNDPELRPIVRDVKYHSITVRAFKVRDLEDRRENYGQVATYKAESGTLKLDVDFSFAAGVSVPVDGNTAIILQKSRYGNFFTVSEPGVHLGLFAPETDGGAIRHMVTRSLQPAGRCC